MKQEVVQDPERREPADPETLMGPEAEETADRKVRESVVTPAPAKTAKEMTTPEAVATSEEPGQVPEETVTIRETAIPVTALAKTWALEKKDLEMRFVRALAETPVTCPILIKRRQWLLWSSLPWQEMMPVPMNTQWIC